MTDAAARGAQILRAGGVVAFPTETVYGLGADASSAAAVTRLYAVKGRPADHPVIVHFAEVDAAFAWAATVPPAARALAARFWPGPLTLILPRADHVGDFVTGGQASVGLRVPAHPMARALLAAFSALQSDPRGAGVAAPSANRFGHVSATCAEHVRADLGDAVDLVLDGGASEVGIESTIVDLSRGAPVLLRPGRIARAALEAAAGVPVLGRDVAAPRHSGGLERHYAPCAPARLIAAHELDAAIADAGAAVAVLAFSRPDVHAAWWRRMPRDPDGYAHALYAALRDADAAGIACILIERPPGDPAWGAVLDRLLRATTPG